MRGFAKALIGFGLGVLLGAGCSGDSVSGVEPVLSQDPGVDPTPEEDVAAPDAGARVGEDAPLVLPDTGPAPEVVVGEDAGAGCDEAGCFGALCTGNDDCDSEQCVWHLGDKVCTEPCVTECPAGWSCQQVTTGGSDLTFACVSDHPTLCLPCVDDAGCAGALALQAVACVSHGAEGAFCATACSDAAPCPGGYECQEGFCQSPSGCGCSVGATAAALSAACERETEYGVCAGLRVCGPEGLSECDALEPAPDVCDGVDNDCDGALDELGCDDGDPCTTDTCAGAEGCVYTPAAGAPCDDGDACTGDDACDASGDCAGSAVVCEDADPCTADTCAPAVGCLYVETGACGCVIDSDCAPPANLCTGVRKCVTTEAQPWPHCELDPETAVVCTPASGPDAACVVVTCEPATGECPSKPVADGEPCDLGQECTFQDTCLVGVCAAGPPIACEDDNPCTDDACLEGVGCTHIANTAACDDADLCTEADTCAGGQCKGQVVSCDDADPCTVDTCDSASGCANLLADIGCSDANPCTDDECQTGVGCVFSANSDPCEDGDACTGDDTCAGGQCKGVVVSCDDGDPCTADSCAVDVGCMSVVFDIGCEDGNPCTDDECETALGCVFTPNTAACDDGDACTGGDACAGGQCKGVVVSCDDGDPCTADSCTAAVGCENVVLDIGCDDGNPCTDDECESKVGCVFSANAASCNDGDLCTEGDACVAGQCKGSVVSCEDDDPCTTEACVPGQGCVTDTADLGCSDGNPCTDDACLAGVGCVFTPNTATCDDDSACTADDQCAAGACHGAPIDCKDNEQCTADSCDPGVGCQNAPLTGAPCEDGDACTAGDVCAGGVCQGGGPPLCWDDDPCTADECSSETGCVFPPIVGCCGDLIVDEGEACDDGGQEGGDGCAADCSSDETCGNGVWDMELEACDGALFPASCQDGAFACLDECATWDTSGCTSWCGDGVLDSDFEACDGEDFPLECWSGALECVLQCQAVDKAGCSAWCGDGVKNGPEECDGGDLSGADCPVGACTCSADCSLKFEGVAQEDEWLDGVLNGLGTQPEVPLHPSCADPNTVCLDASTSSLAHVWIANAASNTVAKINVDSGDVELLVSSGGVYPSRTAVQPDGSVWIGNRGDVAWYENPCNYDFSCSNVIHMAPDGAVICRGDVPGTVRAVSLDSDGNVWAGSWSNNKVYKLSGTEVDDTLVPPRCKILGVLDVAGRAYGAVGDATGSVWLAHNSDWYTSYNPAVQSLQRIDAADLSVVGTYVPPPELSGCYNNYGITVDGQGRVLIGSYRCFGVFRFTPETESWEWRHVPEGTPRGVAVAADGFIYSALSCVTIDCWDWGNATLMVRIAPDMQSHSVLNLGPAAEHPVGASFDNNGRLWTAGRRSNTAVRLDVSTWDDPVPQADYYPTLGNDPYTYSDMTGLQNLMYTSPKGSWSKVVDALSESVEWQVAEWVGITEEGVTGIAARARSAPSLPALSVSPWTPLAEESPLDLSALESHHRYLEVEVQLEAFEAGNTPVLQQIVVHWATE